MKQITAKEAIQQLTNGKAVRVVGFVHPLIYRIDKGRRLCFKMEKWKRSQISNMELKELIGCNVDFFEN